MNGVKLQSLDDGMEQEIANVRENWDVGEGLDELSKDEAFFDGVQTALRSIHDGSYMEIAEGTDGEPCFTISLVEEPVLAVPISEIARYYENAPEFFETEDGARDAAVAGLERLIKALKRLPVGP